MTASASFALKAAAQRSITALASSAGPANACSGHKISSAANIIFDRVIWAPYRVPKKLGQVSASGASFHDDIAEIEPTEKTQHKPQDRAKRRAPDPMAPPCDRANETA